MIRRTESLRSGRVLRRPSRPEAPPPKAAPARKKRRVRLPKFLVRQDWDALIHSCRSVRDRALIVTMLYAALRVSEACALEWRDVNFEEAQLHVRHGKGDKEAFVYMAPAVADVLHTLKGGREPDPRTPVFKSRQGQGGLSRWQAARIVKDAATRAGLKCKVNEEGELTSEVSPHWLRHSCATRMLDAGADIVKVASHLRHSSIAVTQRYTHITNEALKKAVQDL